MGNLVGRFFLVVTLGMAIGCGEAEVDPNDSNQTTRQTETGSTTNESGESASEDETEQKRAGDGPDWTNSDDSTGQAEFSGTTSSSKTTDKSREDGRFDLDSGNEDDENSGNSQDLHVATFFDAMCDAFERCPNFAPFPIAYRIRTECTQILNWAFTCELKRDWAEWGLRKREVSVEEAQVDACVELLKTADCSELDLSSDEGNPCSNAFDFGGESDGNGNTELGLVEGGLDAPCNRDDDCQEDFFCKGGGVDHEQLVSVCQVCKPREPEGTSPCSKTSRQCSDGLWCIYVKDGPRECLPLLADGSDCIESPSCQSGFCNYLLGRASGGWGACDPYGSVGDSCTNETPDQTYYTGCRPNFHCDNGSCAERGKAGASCKDDWECLNNSCHDGVCGVADGENCFKHQDCASQICQDAICVAQGGGACSQDNHCGSGETCEGLCEPPDCLCTRCNAGYCEATGSQSARSEECEDDFDCWTGLCVDGTCTGKLGSLCQSSDECEPLGYCDGGMCVEKIDPGKSCTVLDSCKFPFLCQNGKCEIINLACEPGRIGQGCAMLRVCDDSSYCDIAAGFQCVARSEVGESCSQSGFPDVETCSVGSTCTGGTCVMQPQLGEPCSDVKCAADSYCFEGTCEGPPIGLQCDWIEDCAPGLICDDGVCLPSKPQGSRCREQAECADGLYCKDYDTCEPKEEAGVSCRRSSECREDYYCSRNTYQCTRRLGVGEMCHAFQDASCLPGLRCFEQTCQTALADGENCSSHADCQSGYCHGSGVCLASSVCKNPE